LRQNDLPRRKKNLRRKLEADIKQGTRPNVVKFKEIWWRAPKLAGILGFL